LEWVQLFFLWGSLGVWGIFGAWSVVMALMLVLLSFFSWKDEEVMVGIIDQIEHSSPSSEEKEIDGLREKVVDSIFQNVDDTHNEKAIKLVNNYRKEGYLRPELVLQSKLNEKKSNWSNNGASNR
jgi:hypothetical protein